MKFTFRCISSLLMLFISLNSTASGVIATLTLEKTGFLQPESVVVDPNSKKLFVSNINGQPMELNGKGYISLLSLDGGIIQREWLAGLNAPKGLAVYKGQLFIADQQTLHIVDISTAEIVRSITLDQTKMLNDITVDNTGVVYISDLIGGGIYRYHSGVLSLWISPDKFSHPNGIYFDGETLFVGTWGEGLREDFSTEVLGSLYTVNTQTKTIKLVKGAEKFGNIDGITQINDSLYISDWLTGDIFRYHNRKIQKLFNAGSGSADISAYKDSLLIPMMMDNTLRKYTVK